MERSYAAYSMAAELSPDDARIVNDTGLILAYYLRREPARARELFLRAIELGSAQLEAGIEDPERNAFVTEAVGDAHQNLGVLALTLEGDAGAAREWFLKSIAIGPYPREVVESWYLPLCEKVLAGELDVREVVRASDWALLDPAALAEKLRTEDRLDALIRGQRG
jgi:hypothetical protein